jgi:TRAP transporter TAXI family solute receptor
MVWRPFATKLETAETMEGVALNMRAPYFYPTSTQTIERRSNMNRNRFSNMVIWVLAFSLILWAQMGSSAWAQATGGQEPKKHFLAMGTSSIGGAFYVIGGGICNLIRKAHPEININAEVTGGTHANLVLLGTKKVHLALATNDEAYYAYNGLGKFKGKNITNIRGMLGGHEAAWQLYTLKKTGIKSIADLKGKRISLGAMGSIGNTIGEIVLDLYGLKMKKDWTPEYIGHGQGPDALKDGRVDAVLILTSMPVSAIIDLTSTHGSDVVFLSPERDKMAILLKEHPYWFKTKIPAKTYKGQDQDVPTFGHRTILVIDEAVDAGVVYATTKTIRESYQELIAIHPAMREWTPENATQGILNNIPFHPGAEKYLRETKLLK